MSTHRAGGGHRGAYVAVALAGVLALVGGGAIVTGLSASETPPAPELSAVSPSGDDADASEPGSPPGASPPAPATDLDVPTMPFSEPVGVEVPAVGIRSTTLVPLGRDPDGELEVPEDFDLPGWYVDGPAPGGFGPAVIAGHVDSTSGPAVFFRLGELEAGDEVVVPRADGSTARFEVYRVERYAKDAFPEAEVYGDTTQRSELRLITCGGDFDSATNHYRDNVVVYASLLTPTPDP